MSMELTRHDLYELCVQSAESAVPLLRAIHGRSPRVLGEDFCGTAAMSRVWVSSDPDASAIAIDADPETIEEARRRVDLLGDIGGRVELVLGNVIDPVPNEVPADVIFTGNFSIGYWHARADLLRYLRHVHSRLDENGVFVCDTYGGEAAFLAGSVRRDHPIPPDLGSGMIRYTWEQRDADPLTGMVRDVLHFQVIRAGVIEQEFADAYVYDWRLWSVPELRDAMMEAGFSGTGVYQKLPDAVDDEGNAYIEPVEHPDDLEESFIVCVAARR